MAVMKCPSGWGYRPEPERIPYRRRANRTRAATQALYRERKGLGSWPGDAEYSDELLDELVAHGHMTEAEARDPDARARAVFFLLADLVDL